MKRLLEFLLSDEVEKLGLSLALLAMSLAFWLKKC